MIPPSASICHAVPGRIRVRVPGMRGNEAWFDALCADLVRRPEFSLVSANARTGTILLRGRDLEPDGLSRLARTAGWFELPTDEAAPETPAAAPPLAGIMLMLALVQALRGQVMVPALGFLWYAMELTHWGRRDGD